VTNNATEKNGYISTRNKSMLCCSLTCAAEKFSLFQENTLSNSTPHWVECRTEAVNHLSWSLETWTMVNIIIFKPKIIN